MAHVRLIPRGGGPPRRGTLLPALLLALAGAYARAQGTASGHSRQMELAIRHFDRGEDTDAMDRFMEILVKGNPEERPLANQYMNLISQRMAVGGNFPTRRPTGPTSVEEIRGEPLRPGRPGDPAQLEEVEPVSPRPSSSIDAALPRSDREVMQKEIEGKIHNAARLAIGRLRKYEDIRIQLVDSRAPRAIGIPVDLIFESGVQFKKEASRVLDALTELVFSLGATQAVILPEGGLIGDAKILDMRRTMGISSYLFRAGIAPARVRVNLLSSQVDVPKGMEDFKGILLVFIYNQPLRLSSESPIGEREGPPASLGVFPAEIEPAKEEGSIVEFSVMEPPAGLMSWRFQLLGPDKDGKGLSPVQEVKGTGPVFHQIYWNGRRNYFGALLPPGRYQCVLSATDQRNRTRKVFSWINLRGEPAAETTLASAKKTARAAAPASRAGGVPPSDLPVVTDSARRPSYRELVKGGEPAPASWDSEDPGPRSPRTRPRRGARKPAPKPVRTARVPKPAPQAEAAEKPAEPAAQAAVPEPAAQPAPAAPAAQQPAPAPARAAVVNYPVEFVKNTLNMTQEGQANLGRLSDTMSYYPLDKINIEGYAYVGEPDAQNLAKGRAEQVAKVLVERHGKNRAQMRIQPPKVLEAEVHKVEIYIVSGGG